MAFLAHDRRMPAVERKSRREVVEIAVERRLRVCPERGCRAEQYQYDEQSIHYVTPKPTIPRDSTRWFQRDRDRYCGAAYPREQGKIVTPVRSLASELRISH
jgi:hypothetical protein